MTTRVVPLPAGGRRFASWNVPGPTVSCFTMLPLTYTSTVDGVSAAPVSANEG